MSVDALPDGAVVTIAGDAFTLAHGVAFRWTENGYAPPQEVRKADGLLTPPSTLRTIIAGYRPVLHPDIIGSIPAQASVAAQCDTYQ